jgi:hypothetical protein
MNTQCQHEWFNRNYKIRTSQQEMHKKHINTIPDAEVLINRIWRTVELHLQYNDGRDSQYDIIFLSDMWLTEEATLEVAMLSSSRMD